jgi:hypothetical protein
MILRPHVNDGGIGDLAIESTMLVWSPQAAAAKSNGARIGPRPTRNVDNGRPHKHWRLARHSRSRLPRGYWIVLGVPCCETP